MSGVDLALWSAEGKEWIHYSAVVLNSLPEEPRDTRTKLACRVVADRRTRRHVHSRPPSLKLRRDSLRFALRRPAIEGNWPAESNSSPNALERTCRSAFVKATARQSSLPPAMSEDWSLAGPFRFCEIRQKWRRNMRKK